MNNAEMYEALTEARREISAVNRNAGYTVFNPTATQLLEQVMEVLYNRAERPVEELR